MIRSFFTTNVWLKLASLFLAIALWFFVILSERSGTDIDVPLMYINLSEKFEVQDPQQMIRVRIEGQERLLRTIKQNEISAVLDLSNAKAGRSFYPLTKENIKLPGALEVTGIDPQTITLTIEKHLQKSVKVKPSITGLPAEGYAIIDIKVIPELIVVEGPRSIIANIYSVRTEPIDITGIKRNMEYEARINLTGSNIRKNLQTVKMTISVQKNN